MNAMMALSPRRMDDAGRARLAEQADTPPEMLFFLANFAAILFEISVTKVVQACMSRGTYEAIVRSWQARVLGYCWVCCWLVWIVPRWEYPRIYNSWIEAVLGYL